MSDLSTGLLTAAIGIGIVLTVLCLISATVYLLKLFSAKPVEAETPVREKAPETHPETETEIEYESELAAVIAAAIAQDMGVPPDRLVIRSLKKDETWKENTIRGKNRTRRRL